jgi:microcystin-dependent protein
MRDYWGDTMLERFQPDPVGLPTIWATRTLRDIRISVYAPGTTTLQTIYSARTGGTTKGNPFTTGDDGYAEFYADSGGYDIKMEDTQGPARIATKTIFWNAVNGEAGGIPPTQLAPGITQAQLDAAVTAALWKPGDIKAQGGSAVPTGWLACDGQAVNRATYNALYTALGGAASPWGQGDGATTFNVPDLKGRALSHVGAPTGDATGTTHALGTRFGAETVKLAAAEGSLPGHTHAHGLGTDSKGTHSHGGATGGADRSLGHAHSYVAPGSAALVVGNPAGSSLARAGVGAATGGEGTPDHLHAIGADGAHTHAITGAITAVAAVPAVNNHNNLGPRAAVTCIIKT